MSDRGDSVEQIEKSALQEHATEASLISFARRRRRGGESRDVRFPLRALERIWHQAGQVVGRVTGRGVVEGFEDEEDVEASCL